MSTPQYRLRTTMNLNRHVSAKLPNTTPKISVVKNKPKFESAYKSGTEYSFRSCRGKSVSLGQEKTNFLQFPGNQFVVPFMQLPARMPKPMSQWVGLGRFARK